MKDFVKITEDILYGSDDGFQKAKELLNDRISTYIMGSTCDYEMDLIDSLQDCESPIEQLLALGMRDYKIEYLDRYNQIIESVVVSNQEKIICGDNIYRVDFLISVIYKIDKQQYFKSFVVECDGYEFHQKTKEQVEKDNIRTRDLQKEGYEIIRFSGTEIWHKTYKCVEEIISIIISYGGSDFGGKKKDD